MTDDLAARVQRLEDLLEIHQLFIDYGLALDAGFRGGAGAGVLGAPGRDRYLFVLTIGIGLVGGYLTALTGGIAAAFLGHAITRFAVFLCTGHTGQPLPRGREVEEIEARRRPPRGWRIVGSRDPAPPDR